MHIISLNGDKVRTLKINRDSLQLSEQRPSYALQMNRDALQLPQQRQS